jgi:hypothetical protein
VPKPCSVCTSERREEIDRDIHRGVSTSEIGRRFGFSEPTVKGHRRSAHHLLQTPRQGSTGPHDAESMLKRIEHCLDDGDALADLRIAVFTLPPEEKRVLVAALRSRAGRGKVAEPVLAVAS